MSGPDSIMVSPEQLRAYYNDALRINAEQFSMLERLKRQVNDQAQEIEQLKAKLAKAGE